MSPSQSHLPDRLCAVIGSPYYHPIYSGLICVYLNDVALDYVVEACRSEGWVIKYELNDDGSFTRDSFGKPCFCMLKGKVEYYERKHEREQCKAFLSDYPRRPDGGLV